MNQIKEIQDRVYRAIDRGSVTYASAAMIALGLVAIAYAIAKINEKTDE